MGRKKRQSHIVRLFALALCLLLAAAVLPGRAYAQSGITGGLNWSLTGGTLRISGNGAMTDYTDANMPPWYGAATAVNRIIVGEGVTSIGALAFYGCSAATLASLPSTVTAIGDRAFKNCTALTWVNLPEGLVSIGEAAFESCESLNGITLPDSLRIIENYAFQRCTSLSSIVIPAGVTHLGKVVFYNCTGLTHAAIRCPIDRIPDWFFYGCTALSVLELPETVEKTGDQAFHDCENLSTVHYTGTANEELSETLQSEDSTRFAVVTQEAVEIGPAASSTTFDPETGTSTSTIVIQTADTTITEVTQTVYTYVINGAEATFEEAASSAETDVVEITKETASVISATVSSSDGWKEVATVAKEAAVFRSDDSPVDVKVQLTGSVVSGKDLAALAGVDATVTVSTDEGCVWVIQTKEQTRSDLGGKELDLSFSTELVEKKVTGIESDTVYHVKFTADVDLDAKAGVLLKAGDARRSAVLYEKNAFGLTPVGSVIVDEGGYAWFPVSETSQSKDYFVEVRDDISNAPVPDSMLEDYGVDYEGTLTDASGKQYQVGERESRWGITGKQFTIYVVVALGALVLITSGVMITLNKISRSRAKYATMAEKEADYGIDEEELRLQIMKEMLDEARQGKNNE